MSLYSPEATTAVYASMLTVGLGLTGLRFWTRLSYSKSPLGLDDFFIVVGVMVVTAITSMQWYNTWLGTSGDAISSAEAEQQALISLRVDYATIAVEKIAFGAIKLSFLFFYRRIFGMVPGFRVWNNALMVIVVLWSLSFLLADVFICGSDFALNFSLDADRQQAQCGDRGGSLLAFAVTSVATDIAVIVLPLPYIQTIQIGRRKKWGVFFVFLLGFV